MPQISGAFKTKLVVAIDDDPAIREAMRGLLRSWGYRVVTADSESAALARLDQRPDLIICDYGLANGKVGVDAIKQLRDAFEIPAILITGEAAPAGSPEGRASRYHLMHKPTDPMALQTLLSQMFENQAGEDTRSQPLMGANL